MYSCSFTLNSERNYSDIKDLLLIYFLQKDYSKRCKNCILTKKKKNKNLKPKFTKHKVLCSRPQSLGKKWHFSAVYYTGVTMSVKALPNILCTLK